MLNICVTFFSAKVDSAFHPYGVGEMSTSFCWGLTYDGLVSRPGGVDDSRDGGGLLGVKIQGFGTA